MVCAQLWVRQGMLTLPTLHGRELCFSEGDEGSRGAEQLPAQALAGCLGSPSSALELLTLPMAWLEHRAGRGARLATATWAGTAALWAPFCPLESL